MDKRQAATFTHGREREAKQASHIAAAGCVSACVCLKLSEIEHMIPFVHTGPRTPCAPADLFLYLVTALQLVRTRRGTSCSPDSRGTAAQRKKKKKKSSTDTSCAAGHGAKHPKTVCSVAQTPLPPPSAEVSRRTKRKSA